MDTRTDAEIRRDVLECARDALAGLVREYPDMDVSGLDAQIASELDAL